MGLELNLIESRGLRSRETLRLDFLLQRFLAHREPFTERPLILFITFCVILFTLVVQGLSLPLVIRALQHAARH